MRGRILITAVMLGWGGSARAQAVDVLIEEVVGQLARPVVHPGQTDAEVEIGNIDSAGHRRPQSGRFVAWENGRGGFVVWTFRGTVMHGGTTARLEIAAAAASSIPLRYALGIHTRWSRPDAGRIVPQAGTIVVHSALQDGESVLFELALPVSGRDSAGYRLAELRYEATLNGASAWAAPQGEPRRIDPPSWQPLPLPPKRRPGEEGQIP